MSDAPRPLPERTPEATKATCKWLESELQDDAYRALAALDDTITPEQATTALRRFYERHYHHLSKDDFIVSPNQWLILLWMCVHASNIVTFPRARKPE